MLMHAASGFGQPHRDKLEFVVLVEPNKVKHTQSTVTVRDWHWYLLKIIITTCHTGVASPSLVSTTVTDLDGFQVMNWTNASQNRTLCSANVHLPFP
jgi:hypothetical protein